MREVGAGAAGGGYWVEVGGKGMKEGVFSSSSQNALVAK